MKSCILATLWFLFRATSVSECSPSLTLTHSYPQSGNFSHVRLSCLLDGAAPPATTELQFQLNGMNILKDETYVVSYEAASITVIINQRKEGVFTCAIDGLFSFNAIALAAEPAENLIGVQRFHQVELPTASSVVPTELQCDIQPGFLRQRYSVQWRQLKQNDSIMIDGTFNLTLNIDSSQNGSKYQCEVTIHHDNTHNQTYAGAVITIWTKVMGNGGQDLHQFYKKIIFGVVGFVVMILVILCYVAVVICYCIYTRPRYTSGQDETRNNYYVTDDGVQMETKEGSETGGSETGGSVACGSVACGSFRAGSSLVFSVSSLPSIPEYAHGRQSASESRDKGFGSEPHVPLAPLLATESSTTPNPTGHRSASSDTTNVVRRQENTAPHVALGEAQASPSLVQRYNCQHEHSRLGNVSRISRTSYPDSVGSTASIPSASPSSHSMLPDLLNKVGAHIKDKWYLFGVQLYIPPSFMEDLRHSESQHGSLHYFTQVCIYWEKNRPSAYNWETVVHILRLQVFEESVLAQEIEQTMLHANSAAPGNRSSIAGSHDGRPGNEGRPCHVNSPRSETTL